MKICFLALLLAVTHSLFSQTETKNQLYTWKYFVDRDVEALSLEVIDSTNYLKAYRIWRGFQVMELIQVDDSTFKGQIVNYVTKTTGRKK